MNADYYAYIIRKEREALQEEKEYEMRKAEMLAGAMKNSNNYQASNPFIHINLLNKGSSVSQNSCTVYNITLTDDQFDDLMEVLKNK